MRDLVLYGSSLLPPYSPETDPHRAATTAALLLFPKTVRLVRLCDWYDLPREDESEQLRRLGSIEQTHGLSVISTAYSTGIIPDASPLAFHDRTLLHSFFALRRYVEFLTSYDELFRAGVITSLNLSEGGSDEPGWQRIGNLLQTDAQTILEGLEGLSSSDVLANSNVEDYVLGTRALIESMRPNVDPEIWEVYVREFLQTTDCRRQEFQNGIGRILELLAQELVAEVGGIPTVSTTDFNLNLRNKLNIGVKRYLRRPAAETSVASSLANRLLATAFLALPVILPRTLGAIAEIRSSLADSLDQFRAHLDDLASELIYTESLNERDVQHAVRKHLVRPVQELSRQLAHPSRAVARNLLTSPSIITGAIAFGTAILSGAPVLAPVLAGLSATLSAALKARVDQQDMVASSKVGFLVQMIPPRSAG